MSDFPLFATLSLLILVQYSTQLSDTILPDIYSAINIDNLNFEDLFEIKKKEVYKYECVSQDFKRRVLKDSEISYDAGYEGCGWEISGLFFSCNGKALVNIWAELRRVLNPNIEKLTTKISDDITNKKLKVPIGDWIKSIKIGYSFDNDSVILSQLSIKLNSGTVIEGLCSQPQMFDMIETKNTQRIDGMRMVLTLNGTITGLDFHVSEIVSVGRINNADSKKISQMKYEDFFKSKALKLGRLEDDFYLRGPMGTQKGNYFINNQYYNDWAISIVQLEIRNNRIRSANLILKNKFFDKTLTTDVFGPPDMNMSFVKQFIIPDGQTVNLAIFYHSSNSSLLGIRFRLFNGTLSNCFGICEKTPPFPGNYQKSIYFSNKDNIVGFFGFWNNDGINALGFLLNIKMGTEGSHYVIN